MSSEKKVDFWKEEIEEKNKQLKELEAELKETQVGCAKLTANFDIREQKLRVELDEARKGLKKYVGRNWREVLAQDVRMEADLDVAVEALKHIADNCTGSYRHTAQQALEKLKEAK